MAQREPLPRPDLKTVADPAAGCRIVAVGCFLVGGGALSASSIAAKVSQHRRAVGLMPSAFWVSSTPAEPPVSTGPSMAPGQYPAELLVSLWDCGSLDRVLPASAEPFRFATPPSSAADVGAVDQARHRKSRSRPQVLVRFYRLRAVDAVDLGRVEPGGLGEIFLLERATV